MFLGSKKMKFLFLFFGCKKVFSAPLSDGQYLKSTLKYIILEKNNILNTLHWLEVKKNLLI